MFLLMVKMPRRDELLTWFVPIRMRGTVFVLILLSCAPRLQPVMSWDEVARREVEWPYVLEIDTGKGHLFYFGAAHTYDVADPQLTRIEAAWDGFRPDIAFTEGGFPPIEKTRDLAVRNAGEAGLVRFLAARDDVPTTTLDPSRAEEMATLSPIFGRERIKLGHLLRAASQFRARNGREKIDDEMQRILAIYAQTPGLMGSPRTVAEIEESFARLLPGHGDFRHAQSSWFDPAKRENVFNDIARASSDYRDRYVVDRLVRHVQAGQRVFAVMGGSHVLMQEPALRSRLVRDY